MAKSSKKILKEEESSSSPSSSSEESDSDVEINQKGEEEEELPPVRRLMLPMMAMFQAYGAYVVMQRFLKSALDASHKGGVSDEERTRREERAAMFTFATTLMHWGKLIMRVGHEFLFFWLTTRQRVMLSMVVTLVGVAVVPIACWMFDSKWMGWAYIHFTLLGLGVGVFEVTYLSVISPLGKLTKSWAIMGIPLGLALVDIVGQLVCSTQFVGVEGHHENPQYIYWYIVICIPAAMYIFDTKAPSESACVHQASIVDASKKCKEWLPKMIPFLFAKLIGNFVMENTPGWFYVFNTDKVPLLSPADTENVMDKDIYFCIIYVFVMLGDALSRRVLYCLPLKTKTSYNIVIVISIATSVLGFYLESLLIGWLTFIAAFLAFWGNGMTYAVATKFIDAALNSEYSRAVYGIWTMVGDIGSIIGAGAVEVVNEHFCRESYPYVCAGYGHH